MDHGSAAALNDPAGALFELADRAGIDFPHLRDAREYTETELVRKQAQLAKIGAEPNRAVVVFGSWARREYTEGSDDDWAVLTRGIDAGDQETVALVERCEQVLGVDDRKPGSQPIFGVAFSSEELVEHIGLDDDTNTNLTRRMLLLLESREVIGRPYEDSWYAVLDAYLSRGAKHHRPPRFLLNDLVRYWRTICVDFEGKHRNSNDDDSKWVSRNAKLRTSRKVLFAAGLVPVLLCHRMEVPDMSGFLTGQLSAPPTDRLAAAFMLEDAIEEGGRALQAYDRWMALMQDRAAREELGRLTQDTRDSSELFGEIREIGRVLESGLLALLYETSMAPITRRYVVF